jgi:hypothetical protein
MKGRTSLHHALSALPIPSFKGTILKSLSMPISLTSSISDSHQSVLGEFFTFPHYPFSLIYSVSSSALQTEALEEFLSILRPSFLRKPRSLTTKPRHRLDVTSDHYSLDSRDLTTPPNAQDIHPDARWFSSSLLCACSIVSISYILIRCR